MNHIFLIGRLTREPELKYTPTGTAVITFDLAVDRAVKNQNGERETDFIRIVAWQKLAELCGQYLHKGNKTAVDGRLQVRNYKNQAGEQRQAVEVVANNVEFLERPSQNQQQQPQQQQRQEQQPQQAADEVSGINLDDLPF